MPEFNIHASWKYFKDSADGQAALERFETFSCQELVSFYNPSYSKHLKPGILEDATETFYCYGFSDNEIPTTESDALICLSAIATTGVREEDMWLIFPEEYDMLVRMILPLSYAAYKFAPKFFYPYLYVLRFVDFTDTLDFLGIPTPAIPKRKDYKARYEYYWSFCQILSEVRTKYNLSSVETCAFIYDFIPHMLKEKSTNLPEPTQCWFIGGLQSSEEESLNETYWQVNKDTRPGDILVHYETTPKSAITTMWRAISDGYVDPFFHYHTCGKIGERISVPPISLAELKNDEYFSQFPLTKKNFQGVNGWPVPAEAYQRLMYLLSLKGYDTSMLPQLYAPTLQSNENIHDEKDVEETLLIPFLTSLGLSENINFKRQAGIHVGRGHRVFPDFIVDYKEVDGEDEARILIEAKYHIKNRKDIEDAFKQARSYALNLKSDYIVLCDKYAIMLYEKKNGDFDKSQMIRYTWTDIENPDTFNIIKRIFIKN